MGKIREHKGRSIIALPTDFVVIDTETTGLDYDFCDLIEVSALRIRDGKIVDDFSSLVKPPITDDFFFSTELSILTELSISLSGEMKEPAKYVDEFITELTGITNEMLDSAPPPEDVLPQFSQFIGDDIILGHNVHFDINFLYDGFEKCGLPPLSNDFIDNLRIARKLLPEQSHHRLADVSTALGVSYDGAHRAENDCIITYECYCKLRELALCEGTEGEFIHRFRPRNSFPRKKIVVTTTDEINEDHPLYGKTVVFTGALSTMTRQAAMQSVANVGGINGDTVTKQTNYLVVGSTDFIKSVKNGKTKKMKRAEDLLLKGQDISVISENAFFDLLENK